MATGSQQPRRPETEIEQDSAAARRYSNEEYTPLLPEEDPRTPVLGSIRVKLLVRKNPTISFESWLDNYQSPNTQEEMRKALSEYNICMSPGHIDRFIEALSAPEKNVAYDELRALVEKVMAYKESYEEITEETEKFKMDTILESVGGFLHTEVVEGMQTRPLLTIAKCGAALFLIHKFWKHVIKENEWDKYVYWGGGALVATYLINGAWPNFRKDDSTFTEWIGLKPKVQSEELAWFFEEAGISGSKEKVGLMMKLSDVSFERMVDLYMEARDNGSEQIDVGRLLRDPSLTPEEAAQLEGLNTARLQKALYGAIDTIVELSGAETPSDLKEIFRGETLLSVILQLYGNSGEDDLEEIERRAEAKRYSESDRSANDILGSRDLPEGIEIEAHGDKIWVNGFPFGYKIEEGVIVLAEFGWGKISSESDLGVFLDEAGEYINAEILRLFRERVGDVNLDDINWNSVNRRYELIGYSVPEMPELGVGAGETIDLYAKFSSEGDFAVRTTYDATAITAENFEDIRMKSVLSRRLSEDGPKCCKEGSLSSSIAIESYSGNKVEASVGGSKMTLRYDGEKYVLERIDWNDYTLGVYEEDMRRSAVQTLSDASDGLRDGGKLLGGRIFGVWASTIGPLYKRQFREFFSSKDTEVAQMFAGGIARMESADNLETKIEAYKKTLLDRLKADVEAIAADFETHKNAGENLTRTEFETDYIEALQLAGIASGDYRELTRKMIRVLDSFDYAGSDVLSGPRYKVREGVLELFFEKTAGFNRDGLNAKEKRYIEYVIYRFNTVLNSADHTGWWLDNTVAANEILPALETLREPGNLDDFADWDDGGFTPVEEPAERAEAPEVAAAGTVATATVVETAAAAPEVVAENYESKEAAYETYKARIEAEFESLGGLVKLPKDSALFFVLLELLGLPSPAPSIDIVVQWNSLINLKKEDYLANVVSQNEFFVNYDSGIDVNTYVDTLIGNLEEKTQPIKAIALQDVAMRHPTTYLRMAERLLFIDSDYNLAEIDKGLTARIDRLVEHAADQHEIMTTYSSTDVRHIDAKELYEINIAKIEELSDNDNFQGKQDAYHRYVQGSLAKLLYESPAGVSRENIDVIYEFTDPRWEESDIGLYHKAIEMHEEFADQGYALGDTEVSGYEVSELMGRRIEWVVSHVSGIDKPKYMETELIQRYMEVEFKFFEHKKEFWDKVNGNDKFGERLKKQIGLAEQSVHEIIASLSELPDNNKILLYKSILDFIYDELNRDQDIRAGSIVKHIRKYAKKQLGVELDKDYFTAVEPASVFFGG